MPVTVDQIDALLPQTQCRRCGEDGCRPYAEAVVAGRASINRCPPGGLGTIAALAAALGTAPLPPDPTRWPPDAAALDADAALRPTIAIIDAGQCIGCYKCVLACPVDAIAGLPKFLHAVIDDDCSGCELCLPPCPVDCIQMAPRPSTLTPVEALRGRWRTLHRRRAERLAEARDGRERERRERLGERQAAAAEAYDIDAAIARARHRRTAPLP